MRRPKTSHLNAQQLRANAETFCHFCIHSFVWRGGCEGRPVVGKVCKGFRLAVFVWFTLLFCLLLLLLLFCSCFFFGFEMNVSIHFTLHCVPSGARHAKRTAGLSSQSHRPPHSHLRSFRFRLRSVWRRKVQASQNKPCHSLLGIITICWFASLNTKQQKRRQKETKSQKETKVKRHAKG